MVWIYSSNLLGTKSTTRRDELCDANKRINLTIKHNQLNSGLLITASTSRAKSASDAQILSAAIDGTALNVEKGSYQLQSAEGGATYTILVTAKVKDKNVTFTVTPVTRATCLCKCPTRSQRMVRRNRAF